MTYTPGDAVGVVPENRAEAVEEVLETLGFTGQEPVLDHYKEEISFEEALRTWLAIGKLARGTVRQYAKLPAAAGVGGRGYDALQWLCGPENKSRAEEYCWGREFIDLITDFPGAVTTPQELFTSCPGSRRGSTPSPPARLCIPIPWRLRCALCATTHMAAAGREWPVASWVSARTWARSCPSSCMPTRTSACPRTARPR